MSDHLPECPGNWGVGQMPDGPCTLCDMLRACEQRVWKDPLLVASRRAGWNDALVMAREVMEATHRPVPVIECACGWGKDCPECGSESNRIVGYACHVCCNSAGDHAYCDDLHHEDTPLHHQDGQMWSGPHCPTLAAIDALRGGRAMSEPMFTRAIVEQFEVEGFARGWNGALDAALEAAAALFPEWRYPEQNAAICAAIDALRKEKP